MKMQFLWMVAVCLAWSVISEAATLQTDSNNDKTVIGIVPDADVAREEDIAVSSSSDPRDGQEIALPQLLQSIAEEDKENGVSLDDSDVSVEEHFPFSSLDDDNGEFELICKYRRRRRSRVFRDCKDAYIRGLRRSGVYRIRPQRDGPTFKAYCDMTTDGGGWTVIQRRSDGSVNFYRGWNDYVHGFGDVDGEYFLGLDHIHRLTRGSGSEIRVDLMDSTGVKAFAKYASFSVGDSGSKYTLAVSGYSGTAGDGLTYHNGMKFSTYDMKNDEWSYNCAQMFQGAWWYRRCYQSNLNGLYLHDFSNNDKGVRWQLWKPNSLKDTVMMVRRNN